MVGSISCEFMYERFIQFDHVMKKFNGVGISELKLLELEKRGVKVCKFIVKSNYERSKVYYGLVSQFLNSNLIHTNKLVPNDVQRFVSFQDLILEIKE